MSGLSVNVLTGELTPAFLTPEEIAALPPPTPPPPRQIAKADIWRRASNAEAEILDGMLNAQPVRLRRMWADAQYISTGDELFPTIEAALIQAFGADRAGEILA